MYDLIVVGGGPAGMAAAYSAWQNGLKQILIIERDNKLGGILNQCIHSGFGLHYFNEELTGPEYAHCFQTMLSDTGVQVLLNTTVLQITPQRQVCVISSQGGYQELCAKSLVLAMGCRERTRGAIGTPGTRPSGIFTAGAAQRYINMEGYMVGKRVIILGSGDIGLIMARRLSLEGAKVLACVEVMPFSGGLTRNIVQCLQDFDIPLFLSHTITEIRGKERLSGVTISRVDENRVPIQGTQLDFACDTLLLSVGLIPENELTQQAGICMDSRTGGAVVYENMQTQLPGIFACGNVAHVHDLVDFVTGESIKAGLGAAQFVQGGNIGGKVICVQAGDEVSYTVPQKIRLQNVGDGVQVYFRVRRSMKKGTILIKEGDRVVKRIVRTDMTPGEMEKVMLDRDLLCALTTDILVQIEEEQA